MSKVVVSGLRTGPLMVMIGVGTAMGAFVLYSDLTGLGLKGSLFYRVLGVAVYPVFYGALLIGLWQLTSMFLKRSDYLSVDDETVAIGNKAIFARDISRIILRSSTVSELVVQRRQGADIVIKTWMLSRSANDVLAHLHSTIFKPNAVSP